MSTEQQEEERRRASETSEFSLDSVLHTILLDEERLDVTLRGNDGVDVKALRTVLAARSKVFRSMLYTGFKETEKDVIKIEYSGEVLRSVVQYCFTDQVDLLDTEARNADATSFAQKIVELANAAEFFGLTELKLKVETWAGRVMQKTPSMALVYLEVYLQAGPSGSSVERQALKTIRQHTIDLLNSAELVGIHQATLEAILTDDKIEADEVTLFLLLKQWTEAHPSATYRRAIAKELSAHVNLNKISASELDSMVQPSGLVTSDRLVVAYTHHALAAEEQQPVVLMTKSRARFVPPTIWESSRNQVSSYNDLEFDVFHCPPMSTGVHRWSMRVEKGDAMFGNGIFTLGIICPVRKHYWMYDSDGSSWHMNGDYPRSNQCPTINQPLSTHPEFTSSSVSVVVTFTLNLNDGRGTLTASVDGGPTSCLFNDIFSAFSDGEPVSLVPSAFVPSGDGTVTFLGFEPVAQDYVLETLEHE